MTQQFYKNMALWVVILLMILLLVTMLRQTQTADTEIPYSDFVAKVESGEVARVEIEEGRIQGSTTSGQPFATYAPVITDELIRLLRDKRVEIAARPARESPVWQQILIMWFPFLLLIGLWVFFVRQMQAGGGKAMSFGKSRARLLNESHNRVTFSDVAGVEESKAELEEIIAFLRDPKRFTRLGGRIPKGVLLVGPPGTGKTLLARAVAGEAGVPFFSISGSDFVEMFVGVGASRVRDLFVQGKKNAPCIIFIDEIDAVGRHRGAGLGGGHDEREQTLNQLLVEMDGFESNEGVILIAATNRPDVLDPALLRPGRFDRRVVVPRPDFRGRHAILKVHTRRVPLSDDVNLEVVGRGTPGFVGADLQNLVNEAALLAARRDGSRVAMIDFEEAKDKVLLGAERKSMIMSDEDKRITAYHEGGHALVALLTPGADPVHKVTIIPRGRALGVTMQLPEEDKYNYSRDYMMATITILLAGRAAEEIFLGDMTTGAANDLERSTGMARRMVCEWGMSEELGPLTFGKNEEQIFLGREISRHQDYSESTAVKIDQEVQRIILDSDARSRDILNEHQDALKRLAEALLEYETLDSDEIEAVIKGEPIREDEEKSAPPETPESDPATSQDDKGKPLSLVNPKQRPAPA